MANNENTQIPAESDADFDFAALDAVEADYRAEMDADYWSPVEQGYYDDDPSPYSGDYSEM